MSNLSKKDLATLCHVRPLLGRIERTIREMIRRANLYDIRVNSVINNVEFSIKPGMSVEEAVDLYNKGFTDKLDTFDRSMQGELHRRRVKALEDEDKRIGEYMQSLLTSEKLEIKSGKELDFSKLVRKNSSTYSKMVMDYAMSWGIAMQQAMREGKKIQDVAYELSDKLDYLMSGSSHMMGLYVLCDYWVHGEELQKLYMH